MSLPKSAEARASAISTIKDARATAEAEGCVSATANATAQSLSPGGSAYAVARAVVTGGVIPFDYHVLFLSQTDDQKVSQESCALEHLAEIGEWLGDCDVSSAREGRR